MQFFKKLRARGLVGIEVLPDALAIAVGGEGQGLGRKINQLSIQPSESTASARKDVLTQFVTKHHLAKMPCNIVLTHFDYQLVLVEAPDVPQEEMREAIRWRVKDLIDTPIDRAAIDIFMLPENANKIGKAMAYVVSAEMENIRELVEVVNESGLELSSIDIGELSLRNISVLHEEGQAEGRGVAIVRLQEGLGTVSLFRQGNLYLSRQFQLDYQAGLLDELPVDNFILEIQRSLDYYERQMGQVPPAALYICGDNVSEDKITEDIVRGVPVPAKYLDLAEHFELENDAEESFSHSCICALGAIIRGEVTA